MPDHLRTVARPRRRIRLPSPTVTFPRATTERLLRQLTRRDYFTVANLIWVLAGEAMPVQARQYYQAKYG